MRHRGDMFPDQGTPFVVGFLFGGMWGFILHGWLA